MSPVLSTFSGASARAFGFGYNFASSAFEHIETQTVGAGGAASITFSSIPGTYKHLQIRGVARQNNAQTTGNPAIRLNGDSGSNYTLHILYGDGSSASSYGTGTGVAGDIMFDTAANAGANIFGAFVIDLLDYASTTKNKTVRSLTGADLNGSGSVRLYSVAWLNNTSAVTSVSFVPNVSASFVQHSTFSLYGVKA